MYGKELALFMEKRFYAPRHKIDLWGWGGDEVKDRWAHGTERSHLERKESKCLKKTRILRIKY